MTCTPNSVQSPVTHAWDEAVTQFARWIGPLEKPAVKTARQCFLAYCRMRSSQTGLDDAAPLIAFGFLTKAAFDDARRKSRIYG